MTDLYLNRCWLTSIIVIILFIDKISTVTICPTAVWTASATTVAGSRTGSSGSTSTKLYGPTSLFVDNTSAIYVADSGNLRVQWFPPNSTTGITVVNSSYGFGLNQFMSMDSMNVDASGNIYILDGKLVRVTKWAPKATTGTLVASGLNYIDYYGGYYYSDSSYNNHYGDYGGRYSRVSGMFVEAQTMIIWIADTYNSNIVKWTNASTRVVVCGSYGSGPSQFMFPEGLFVDTNTGNILYVADTYNHRIQMWLPGATSGVTVAGITSYYGTGLNQLWYPQTLIVDTNGNMYIVDHSNSRIMKWMIGASSGVIIAGTTTYGTQTNQLNRPYSISFDSNGSLFISDTRNNRVQKFAISCPTTNTSITTTPAIVTTATPISTSNCSTTVWASNATTIAGSPIGFYYTDSTRLDFPEDMWVDANNNLYVLDSYNYRVQLYVPGATSGTTIINSTYGNATNQFYYMDCVSIDTSGNIYVLDDGNARVTKWVPGTSTATVVAGGNGVGSSISQLYSPLGMFVESNTSIIWIADTGNSRIVKWSSPTTGVLVAGSYGTKANQFQYPYGLFVDTTTSNTLYVADTYNHRIQKWLSSATSGTTVAGQTGVSGSGLNQLTYPKALVVDQNGAMYIVDNGNNRIVRWMQNSTSGVVIAGTTTYGTLPNQLWYPLSIKFDSSGALIVADSSNNRIQKFSIICSSILSIV